VKDVRVETGSYASSLDFGAFSSWIPWNTAASMERIVLRMK